MNGTLRPLSSGKAEDLFCKRAGGPLVFPHFRELAEMWFYGTRE
jgi:hypothetical protein